MVWGHCAFHWGPYFGESVCGGCGICSEIRLYRAQNNYFATDHIFALGTEKIIQQQSTQNLQKEHDYYSCTDLHVSFFQACAPLYQWSTYGLSEREPVGTCFLKKGNSIVEYSPCRSSTYMITALYLWLLMPLLGHNQQTPIEMS